MPHRDGLMSQMESIRAYAVKALQQERKATVDELIEMIDPANAAQYSEETRCLAAFLLGEHRAAEAVPVLSRALADEPGPKATGDISRYEAPVWNALVKIGRPAVPEMIKNVQTSDDSMLRKKSMDVLIHVLGGKGHVLELLDKLNTQASDTEISRRIREAHSWAESYYKNVKDPLY